MPRWMGSRTLLGSACPVSCGGVGGCGRSPGTQRSRWPARPESSSGGGSGARLACGTRTPRSSNCHSSPDRDPQPGGTQGRAVLGSVHLERLHATGEGEDGAVRLRYARIGGNLYGSETRLTNEAGPALDAREMQLGEAALLGDRFQATGAASAGWADLYCHPRAQGQWGKAVAEVVGRVHSLCWPALPAVGLCVPCSRRRG